MDFRHILNEIEQTDPEVYEKLSGRRQVLKSFGSKVAVAALPLAVASLFKKAYGKTTDVIINALNAALQMEYFEYNFFYTANNVASLGLIPLADQPGFAMIQAHELGHINFLKTTIANLGGTPFTPNHYSDANSAPPYIPNAYDFTASGTPAYAPFFANVFNDYPTFLIAAEIFQDTAVRAYGGQLQNVIGNAVFAQVQQIASTEGRHAAYVRLLRRNSNAPETPAPWINNSIPPVSPVAGSNLIFQPFYNGEDNIQQLNVSIGSLPDGTSTVPLLSATAAFDEPISQTTLFGVNGVNGLLTPFILL